MAKKKIHGICHICLQEGELTFEHVPPRSAFNNSRVQVVQGDAASLPFADRTFTSAIAILVLHHLRSSEQQDRAFAEVHRVLQPRGHFFAFEIPDGWFNRVIHTNSTFVPVGYLNT